VPPHAIVKRSLAPISRAFSANSSDSSVRPRLVSYFRGRPHYVPQRTARVSHCDYPIQSAGIVAQTVMSALDQDYEDLEVVVADDASNDTTPDILRQVETKYPAGGFVFSCSHGTKASRKTRTAALRACTGEFVAFQGGDDVLAPGQNSCTGGMGCNRTRREYSATTMLTGFDSSTAAPLHLFSQLSPAAFGCGAPGHPRARELHARELGNGRRRNLPFVLASTVGLADRCPTNKLWTRLSGIWGRYGFVPGVLGAVPDSRCRRHDRQGR